MPFQPGDYQQFLVPNVDTGPNQWGATGVPHWAEIDESYLAPNTADRIFARGASMGGKIEVFGVTLPNKPNLEGGFDHIGISVYAWRDAVGINVPLILNLYIKGAWRGAQTVTVVGVGGGGVAWYTKVWSVFNCDMNDADDALVKIEVDPGFVWRPVDGVIVATVNLAITGQDILTTAKAKLSQFI